MRLIKHLDKFCNYPHNYILQQFAKLDTVILDEIDSVREASRNRQDRLMMLCGVSEEVGRIQIPGIGTSPALLRIITHHSAASKEAMDKST